MFKYILAKSGEINWMALFSLCTFFFVFITASILMLRKDKRYIQHMENMPLEEEITQS